MDIVVLLAVLISRRDPDNRVFSFPQSTQYFNPCCYFLLSLFFVLLILHILTTQIPQNSLQFHISLFFTLLFYREFTIKVQLASFRALLNLIFSIVYFISKSKIELFSVFPLNECSVKR